MGCDIHDYIERYHEGRWQLDAANRRRSIMRDYELFGLLTNGQVRCPEYIGTAPNPRGVPNDLSQELLHSYALRVVADEDYEQAREQYDEAYESEITLAYPITRSAADQSQQRYGTRQFIVDQSQLHVVESGDWLENGDLHSHSYLTLDECRQVQAVYEQLSDGRAGDFYAPLGFQPQVPPEWWPKEIPERGSGRVTIYPEQELDDVRNYLDQHHRRLAKPLFMYFIQELAEQMTTWAEARLQAGHTVSYYQIAKPDKACGPHRELAQVIDRLEIFADQGIPARFVFWFDN